MYQFSYSMYHRRATSGRQRPFPLTERASDLVLLVAGAGFEPATFGL